MEGTARVGKETSWKQPKSLSKENGWIDYGTWIYIKNETSIYGPEGVSMIYY